VTSFPSVEEDFVKISEFVLASSFEDFSFLEMELSQPAKEKTKAATATYIPFLKYALYSITEFSQYRFINLIFLKIKEEKEGNEEERY